MKFKLGDHVICTKTGGGLHYGHVYGIMQIEFFRKTFRVEDHIKYWLKTFGDNLGENVLYIWLHAPQKVCSLQELREAYPGLHESKLHELYETTITSPYVSCPEIGVEFYNGANGINPLFAARRFDN
jgi:hypothetical protein